MPQQLSGAELLAASTAHVTFTVGAGGPPRFGRHHRSVSMGSAPMSAGAEAWLAPPAITPSVLDAAQPQAQPLAQLMTDQQQHHVTPFAGLHNQLAQLAAAGTERGGPRTPAWAGQTPAAVKAAVPPHSLQVAASTAASSSAATTGPLAAAAAAATAAGRPLQRRSVSHGQLYSAGGSERDPFAAVQPAALGLKASDGELLFHWGHGGGHSGAPTGTSNGSSAFCSAGPSAPYSSTAYSSVGQLAVNGTLTAGSRTLTGGLQPYSAVL